jgi:hypothetical protein
MIIEQPGKFRQSEDLFTYVLHPALLHDPASDRAFKEKEMSSRVGKDVLCPVTPRNGVSTR